MKHLLALSVFFSACLAGFAQNPSPFGDDTMSVRADAVIDDDYSVDGDTAVGAEVALAGSMFEMDEAGIFLHYVDENDDLYRLAGVFVEEYFDIGLPLYPFIGAALGYGWQELQGRQDDEGVVVRGQTGLKLQVVEWFALSARVQYSISSDDLFVNEDGTEGNNLEYAIGARFYY